MKSNFNTSSIWNSLSLSLSLLANLRFIGIEIRATTFYSSWAIQVPKGRLMDTMPMKSSETAHSSTFRKGRAQNLNGMVRWSDGRTLLHFHFWFHHSTQEISLVHLCQCMCIVYREPKDLWYKRVFLLLSDILIHDLFTKLPKQGVILFWMLA